MLRRALGPVLSLDTPEDRGRALARLSPWLPDALREHALTAVSAIEDPGTRVELLAEIAPHLPSSSVQVALGAVPPDADEQWRAIALMQLASRAAEPEWEAIHVQAVEAAGRAGEPDDGLRALARLASDPVELSAILRLRHELTDYRGGQDLPALRAVIPLLPSGALQEATEIVRAKSDACVRSCALATLVFCAPEAARPALLKEALDAACAYHNHADETYCQIQRRLTEAARQVPEAMRLPLLSLDLNSAGADPGSDPAERLLRDPDQRIRQLVCLAAYLPASDRQEVLDSAIQATREIIAPRNQIRALSALAPHLLPSHLPQAVEHAGALEEPSDRRAALIELAAYSPPEDRLALLARAADATSSSEQSSLAELVVHLAGRLTSPESTDLLDKALDLIRSDPSDERRARDIALLAPHLPVQLFDKASQIGREISAPSDRAASQALSRAPQPEQQDSWAYRWRPVLAAAAIAGRPALLSVAVDACLDIGSRAPTGTPEPIATYFARSILDIERWWPGGSRPATSRAEEFAFKMAEMIDTVRESDREKWMSPESG